MRPRIISENFVGIEYLEHVSDVYLPQFSFLQDKALFIVTTWLFVGLRVYIRGCMIKSLGMDDWLMVLTLVGTLQ